MDADDDIRALSRQVLGQPWTPHENDLAALHTRCDRETLPPTTMIGTRPTVTIACPRPDYEALMREDEAYAKTLTFWQRLMRPRPFWRKYED